MWLKSSTKLYQEKLAQYTRDGKLVDIKGVKKDRLHHYRRLTFNIQLQTMEQAFPIAYSIFDFDDWQSMIHDFFNHHNAKCPQIWKLPFEFYQFVLKNNYAQKFNLPFLNDLLFFEWIEIDVHTMDDKIFPHFNLDGNEFNDVLVLNPEYRLDKLEYPVHKIKPTDIGTKDKSNYFLLTYREKETGQVYFIELSVLHTFAFEKITQESKSIRSITDEAISIFGNDHASFINDSLVELVSLLKSKNRILGFAKK